MFNDLDGKVKTFTDADIQINGEYFLGQLEKLDQKLYGPIYSTTYQRDIKFRSDVTLFDNATSYQKVFFRATDGDKTAHSEAYVNAAPGVDFETIKISNPLYYTNRMLDYNIIDLETSRRLNRPIDSMKIEALAMVHHQEIERIVYTGDTTKKTTGLLNNEDAITSQINLNANWLQPTTKPDSIVKDFNDMLMAAWKRTNFNIMPSSMLISPTLYGALVERKVSEAGNMSVLNYVLENNIAAKTGTNITINPLRWLETGLTGAVENRIVLYTNEEQYIRLPYVPFQRFGEASVQGLTFRANYVSKFGHLEVIYPELLTYFKVKTA